MHLSPYKFAARAATCSGRTRLDGISVLSELYAGVTEIYNTGISTQPFLLFCGIDLA